jgi:hypothetical protein
MTCPWRNSPCEAARHRRLPHSPPPPSLHHNRALGTMPPPNPTATASTAAGVAVAAGAAGAAAALRSSITPPSSSRSNRLGVTSPSASPLGAGPPSTSPGRAPSSCGPVPAILLWRPYLDRRNSNMRLSPNNSHCSSRRCSRTSSLLLQLAPLRVANGGRPAPTTPWPASPPGIHSRSPSRSARQH